METHLDTLEPKVMAEKLAFRLS